VKISKDKIAVWSVAIAALGLIVALVFNSVQVKNSATAQDEAKVAAELALLAQIQSSLTKSVYSRVPYAEQFHELRAGLRTELSPKAYRVTAEEASNMNYFAWLFNNDYLSADGADEVIGPQMICEFQRAFVLALRDPAGEVTDLIQFKQERGAKLEQFTRACT
jgi:hypothetical protein